MLPLIDTGQMTRALRVKRLARAVLQGRRCDTTRT